MYCNPDQQWVEFQQIKTSFNWQIIQLCWNFAKEKNVLRKDAKWLEEVTEYNYSKWLKQIK